MELSEGTLRGLCLIGEEAKMPAAAYKEFLTVVFKDVSSNLETSISKLADYPNLSKMDQSILKEAYSAALIVVLEASKFNLDSPGLTVILEDCKIDAKRIELFLKGYESKKTDIRAMLGASTFNLPHIVDVDWRLDYYVKSKKLEKVNKLEYLLELKTQENDGKEENIMFSTTVEQLQDLVNKLKDAQKSIQTIQAS